MVTRKKAVAAKALNDLISIRKAGLYLTSQPVQEPKALVHSLGAIQAQHLDMSIWALGLRLSESGLTRGDLEAAIEKGKVLRTHILRPTWHWVASEDLFWMLELTAPSIRSTLFSRDKHLGIEAKEYIRSDKVICRVLEEQGYLSKQSLSDAIASKGMPMDEYRSNHYIMHAELSGLICSGPLQQGKHTYRLAQEAIGVDMDKALHLKKDLVGIKAVAELARRYFQTRGPATIEDFKWWSGLNVTAIKAAIKTLEPNLETYKEAGKDYYYYSTNLDEGLSQQQIQFLPAFDEYLISFKDRTSILEDKYMRQVITANGMFRPFIIESGKVIGIWQVEKGKRGFKFTIQPFEPIKGTRLKNLQSAARQMMEAYGIFHNRAVESFKIQD